MLAPSSPGRTDDGRTDRRTDGRRTDDRRTKNFRTDEKKSDEKNRKISGRKKKQQKPKCIGLRLDLLLPGQQRNLTHLGQVHPHRVVDLLGDVHDGSRDLDLRFLRTGRRQLRIVSDQANVALVGIALLVLRFRLALDDLEAGHIDLVISSLTITPRRNARVAFAGPYLISGSLLLTREEIVDSLEQVSELNSADRSWAALRGSTGEALILELFPLATFVAVDDMETVVPRVAAGEVDGLFADVPFVQFQIARHPASGLAALPSPFTTEPLGVAVPADSPLFANLVQNYLNTLDYTGMLMQMKMHWMSAGEWLSEVE